METNQSHLAARIAHQLGENPLDHIEAIRQANIAYKRQKARADGLEHGRKIVLAELIEKHREAFRLAGEKASETRLETLARADKTYRECILQIMQARQEEAVLEADFWAKKERMNVLLEMMRFARTEIQTLDYVT